MFEVFDVAVVFEAAEVAEPGWKGEVPESDDGGESAFFEFADVVAIPLDGFTIESAFFGFDAGPFDTETE